MPITTTPSERIGRCTRMRRFFVRFNRSESFVHTQSSAGFTIITSGFEFSVHTGTTPPCAKLTGDSASGFEAALISDCRLFRLSAENQSPGILGVLQHYRHKTDVD